MTKFVNKKILIIGFFAVVFLATLIILFSQSNSNRTNFTVKGSVQNSLTGDGFSPDRFTVGGIEVKTDENGTFDFQIVAGEHSISITEIGYIEYNEKLKVTGDMKDVKILVLPENLATFRGKLVAEQGHIFRRDLLSISNVPVPIAEDGTFSGSILAGSYTLEYSSENYVDVTSTITLAKGENNLKELTLEEAGDINGELKSYLREENVKNLEIIAENTTADQIEIDYQEGKFKVKDLKTLTIYSLLFKAPGYLDREYKITIKQGANQIFDLRFVENSTALFPKAGATTRENPNLYISDLDGKNQTQISRGNTTNIFSRYLDATSGKIYFQSADNNNVKDFARRNIGLVYEYDLKSKQVNLVTTNTENINTLYPKFSAKKMIQYKADTGKKVYSISISDLSGDNNKSIYSGSNEISQFLISKDGKYVVFTLKVDQQILVYRYSVVSDLYNEIFRGTEVNLYDVSTDGNKVLYYRKNISSGFFELVEFIVDRNNNVIIEENFKGKYYEYLDNGKNDTIIYSTTIDGRENLYYYNTETNARTRLISLDTDLKIDDIYQESNIIFYLTNKGLYAVDFSKPFANKLVTSEVFDYVK